MAGNKARPQKGKRTATKIVLRPESNTLKPIKISDIHLSYAISKEKLRQKISCEDFYELVYSKAEKKNCLEMILEK